MNFFALFVGGLRVRFRSPRPERIVNAARRSGLPFHDLSVTEEEASFEILLPRKDRLQPFLETLSITESVVLTEYGLPALLKRYRRRWGFFAGLAFYFACMLLATCFVWGVDVSGVTREPETVFAALADAGLSPGTWGRGMDTDGAARRFLVLHPEYAYAGIRLTGMRALVELRETETIDKSDPTEGYANLVASGSGRVVRCEVMAGERLVKPGDLVKKGDLLISGIRKTESGSFIPTRARGRVLCETEEAFETFVPLASAGTIYTGREEERFSLYLLGRRFFTTGENAPFPLCDSQVFYEPVRLFGWDLPVYRKTIVYSEKAEKTTVTNVDRARDLAYDEYAIYKGKLLDRGGDLKAEEFFWEEGSDGVILRVKITAVRDLCREVPFTVL